MMKKYPFKKVLTACLLASMAVTAFGCNRDSNENGSDNSSEGATAQETISLADAKQPLTFVPISGEEAEATEGTQDNAETPETTAPQAVEVVEVTEVIDVTDADGQVQTDDKGQKQTEVVKVTEVVPVTDTNGQVQTDSKGQTQTEVVPVTETKPITEAQQPATVKPNETATETKTSYSPSYDRCKAYWLDMSQEGDFFFEGEFLIISFEIKKDIPDGSYPVTIQDADIASWDVVKWVPQIINGEVAVNTTPQKQADFPDSDFALKVESVQAKQGDIVDVKIDLKNNPGFCGFVMDIQYDKAAMDIVGTYGGENFNNTAINYVAK